MLTVRSAAALFRQVSCSPDKNRTIQRINEEFNKQTDSRQPELLIDDLLAVNLQNINNKKEQN